MPSVFRPVPDDFTAFAQGKTLRQLRLHYKTGESTVSRWLHESGVRAQRHYAEPLPETVAEMAKTMSLTEIAAAIKMHRCTFAIKFRQQFPGLHELAKQNGLRRAQEAGAQGSAKRALAVRAQKAAAKQKAKAEPRAVKAPAPAPPKQARRGTVAVTGFVKPAPAQDRINSEADAARAFLQRFGPCFSRKVYGPKCEGYVFNNQVYSADALIDEAVRRGWDPDSTRFLTP